MFFPSRGTWLWLAVAALVFAPLIIVSCSTPPPASPQPVSYPQPDPVTVSYAGECYTGYLYTEHEADMLGVPSTCERIAFPPQAPAADMDGFFILMALHRHRTAHAGFYSSGYYYDQYLRPASARYQVTIITKTSFMTEMSEYTVRNRTDITVNASAAQWTGGRKGPVTFPSSNGDAASKPVYSDPARTGGEKGTDRSRSQNSGRSSTSRSGGGKR